MSGECDKPDCEVCREIYGNEHVAQLCPVCGGSGRYDRGLSVYHGSTAVSTSNWQDCHGCLGRGWVVV